MGEQHHPFAGRRHRRAESRRASSGKTSDILNSIASGASCRMRRCTPSDATNDTTMSPAIHIENGNRLAGRGTNAIALLTPIQPAASGTNNTRARRPKLTIGRGFQARGSTVSACDDAEPPVADVSSVRTTRHHRLSRPVALNQTAVTRSVVVARVARPVGLAEDDVNENHLNGRQSHGAYWARTPLSATQGVRFGSRRDEAAAGKRRSGGDLAGAGRAHGATRLRAG